MQALWKEQNSHTFEVTKKSMALLESLLIRTLFNWSRAWGLTNSNSHLDFNELLYFCAFFFFEIILGCFVFMK